MSMLLPNAENDYYWRLTKKDGSYLDIPPKGVPVVQRKVTAKEPIRTSSEVIPFSEVKSFEKTSRRFTDMKLLTEAAYALDEPVITEDGAVKARWVKRQVTQSEYDRKYSKDAWYRYINNGEGMVTIAFIMPVHKIDLNRVEYCTPEEERKLGL